jgi:hypothetical protein
MLDASAVGALYVAAIHQCWPLHHLEESGAQLDHHGHPGLRMNRGRVNRPISSDNLGKLNEPTSEDCHRHSGPEWEHDFDMCLWEAARLTGSPACQWLMSAHARLRWFSSPRPDEPGNWLPPNRGVGWYCFKGAELYRGLQDRELAGFVKRQYHDVFTTLIQPQMGTPEGWWSWSTDPRIGASPDDPRAQVWQCNVLAAGLWHAGDAFDDLDSHWLAQQIGEDTVYKGWKQDAAGRWHSVDLIAHDGRDLGIYDGYYPHFGVNMGTAAQLLWNPTHAVAGSIWRQCVQDSTTWQQASWLCPGVVLR